MTTVAICGAGQMGAAAALCFQRAGYRTWLWLRDPRKLPAVKQTLSDLESWMNQHVGPATSTAGTLEAGVDFSRIDEGADVIVDCIGEAMQDKVDLFRKFPGALARKALFLTTTSGLSITELGRQSGTGAVLVGTHFWNPPHLMPLVEVIRGEDTPVEVMERVVTLVESIGKIAVRVNRDVPGFIGNRLLHALWREAINLVGEGIASPADVDRVARLTFGLRLPAVGPLENMDLVGLDLIHAIHQYLMPTLANDTRPLPLLAENVRERKLGMKTGAGFYDWTKREPKELVERRDQQIVHQLDYLNRQKLL